MTEAVFKLRVSVEPDAPSEPWNGSGVAGMVVKADDERRFTLMMGYPANQPDANVALDGHRDFATAEATEQAAWSYMTKSRNVGLWHADGTDGAGTVVESYIYRGPQWTITAVDGSERTVKAGDWLVGIQWSPESWDLIKSGEITGASMQGRGTRRIPTAEALAGLTG